MLSASASKLVLRELADLSKESTKIEGLKVYPNDDDFTDIAVELAGPQGTPYEGGNFKMRLKLSEEYPDVPPKVFIYLCM